MGRIRKALVKPKRLKLVFNDPESSMQVQIARVCVFYEDLRIELLASAAPPGELKSLERAGADYRRLYFLRRAVATLVEMDGAFHKLNMDPEFKALKRRFSRERLRQWTHAVKYFARIHEFLTNERNLYGGHFQDDAARFALQRLDPDHIGILEITFNTLEGTFNTVFKFALEFVGVGSLRRSPEVDHCCSR
jgi:hypothetical protein